MKSLVLLLTLVALNAAQPPAYYKQVGSYHTIGGNVGLDFPVPRIPELELRVFSLPLPLPTLRQSFLNVPVPQLKHTESFVRAPARRHY